MLHKRLLISLLLPLALALATLQVAATQPAQPTAPSALTIAVNEHDDAPLLPNATACDVSPLPGNQCTLRAAIQFANRSSLGVVIIVPASVYSLTITGSNEDAAATG